MLNEEFVVVVNAKLRGEGRCADYPSLPFDHYPSPAEIEKVMRGYSAAWTVKHAKVERRYKLAENAE
jgi:hypothetical protein